MTVDPTPHRPGDFVDHLHPKPTKPRKPKPVPLPPTLAGANPLLPTDPVSVAVRRHRQEVAHPDEALIRARTILRRQNVLKALGLYTGEIDGIWGAQSQKAWSIYVYRQRHHRSLTAPLAAPKQLTTTAKSDVQAFHVERVRAVAEDVRRQIDERPLGQATKDRVRALRAATASAQQDARRQIAFTQKTIERDAALIRSGQRDFLRKMDVNRFARVVSNRAVRWDWTNPRDLGVVKDWLGDHGYPVAPNRPGGENGQPSARADAIALNDTLKRAIHDEQVRERNRAVRELTRDFYADGRLTPGAPVPSWWPRDLADHHQTVPKPGELLALLQRGGVQADLTLTALADHSNIPDLNWQTWRDQQLRELMSKLDLGSSGMIGQLRPDFLARTGPLALRAMQVLDAAAVVITDDKARGEFKAQVDTLVKSRDIDDFERRISSALQIADQQYTREQLRRAKHRSWWGKALEWGAAPGKFLRTAIVADMYMGADLLAEGHLRDRADYWEGSAYAWEHGNPIARLAGEFLIDPLVYLRPIRVGSTAIRFGARNPLLYEVAARTGIQSLHGLSLGAESLGGYVRREGAMLGRLPGDASRVVRYSDATWHLGGKAFAGDVLRKTPGIGKMIALKQDAVDRSVAAVQLASRHFFDDIDTGRWTGALPRPMRVKLRSTARRVLARQLDEAIPAIRDRYGDLYDEMLRTRTSLYARATGRELSQTGAAMLARHLEGYRIQATHQLATSSARDVYERALSGGLSINDINQLAARFKVPASIALQVRGRVPFDDILNLALRSGDHQQYVNTRDFLDAVHRQLGTEHKLTPDGEGPARLAREEYNRVLDGAGLHFGGGNDPEIRHQIAVRLAAMKDKIENTILPLLQRALEQDVEALGESLWDDSGKWAYMNGDEAKGIEALARDSFHQMNLVEVENRAFDVPLSFDQALVEMESQISIRQARVLRWIARKEAEGKSIPDEAKAAMLGREREAVESGWVFGDGRYHAVINQDGLRQLLSDLNLPANTRVRLHLRDDAWMGAHDEKGWFDHVTKTANVNVARYDLRLTGAQDTAAKGVTVVRDGEHHYSGTALHEIRHAFQDMHNPTILDDYVDPLEDFDGYFAHPSEVDARAFAEEFLKRMPSLVRVVRPGPGQAVDARPTLRVSDLYARDVLDAVAADPTAEVDASAGVVGRAFSTAPTGFDLSFIARDPMETFGSRTAFDTAIDRLTWDLGGVHSDQPMTDIARGLGLVGDETRAVHPSDRSFIPRGEDARDVIDEARAFRDTIEGLHVAVANAQQEAIPQALRDNYAFMAAWARSTSWWGEYSYKTVQGAMSVWIFASLPLRPGWVVRNVADNQLKALIAGARDPRAYLAPAVRAVTGQKARSVFESGVGQAYEALRFLDRLFGTNAADGFKLGMESFWMHQTEVLQRIFHSHGWNVPAEVLEGARFNPFEQKAGFRLARVDEEDVARIADPELRQLAEKMVARGQDGSFASFRDKVWHVMANVPENAAKKAIYNDTMAKLTAEGMAPVAAHKIAWKKVEDTLFDYSRITVIEDNLRVFFPFIQFWRKNTGFWVKSVASKPWLTEEFLNYQRDRDNTHKDWPDWMKRYTNMRDIADAASFIPGLEWLVDNTGISDAQFDPLSFISFNTYYRAWKSRNDNLAPEQQGGGFLGGVLDALDQWGLGLNPFIRKPLESAHVADAKSWMAVFPETSLAAALTRKWFGDNIANRILDWERIFTLYMGSAPSDQIAANFNFYVQREVADQIARGERPNRAKAEDTIRAWFYAQNAWGFFGGVYFRKNSPEDFYLSKLQDDIRTGETDYGTLADEQKLDLKVWKAAKELQADPLAFDRYTTNLPLVDAYFRQPDYQQRQQMLVDNPELTQYVDPLYTSGHVFSPNYIAAAALYQKSQEFFAFSGLERRGRLAYDVRQAANAYLITPELRDFWAQNDTDEQVRAKMVKAELYGYIQRLQKTYFSLPENDIAARQGFLDEHPELADHWLKNDLASDDFTAIHNAQNASLREAYFHIVQTNGKRGFSLAQPFLHDHPFIFEGTSAARKVDPNSGEWITAGAVAYRRAEPYLKHFFALVDHDKKAAYAWLNADSDGAKIVRDFFKKHGKHSAKQRDYLRARKWLTLFWDMPKADRYRWLDQDGRGQRVVKWYFKKYAHSKGMTAHARDYLAVKSILDRYFAMSTASRSDWLNSDAPEAKKLLAYFKTYGEQHASERAWAKAAARAHLVQDPELRQRVDFWTRYFALTPDKRPAFLHAQARAHGIFIWGAIGDDDAHAREQRWIREAMAVKFTLDGKPKHLTEKQASYLYVKPLLDVYNNLPQNDRKVFAATNPEVAAYFSQFSRKHLSGSKKTDKLVEQYFALPEDSLFRSKFLREHPEVQRYFDQHSTPQERAIRATLNVYFSLSLHERKRYAAKHPELAVYFDRRRRERAAQNAVNEQLLREDPRLTDFFASADADIPVSAAHMAANLREAHVRRFRPDTLETRRDRRTLA